MKIESLLTTLGLLGGTGLSVRLLNQGVELALVATAIEWSAQCITVLRRRLHAR